MVISVVLPDNINTASRASKEILTFVKLNFTVKLIYMPPAYAYEDMRNNNVSEFKRIRLLTRNLPKNIFFWVIKYFEFFLRVFFGLVKQRPNVVFCHDLMPLIPSFVYAKLFSKKFIYDSHEIHRAILSPFKPQLFWEKVETYIINHSNLTFITDHHRMEYMITKAAVSRNKIVALYNFPYLKELSVSQKGKLSEIDQTRKKIIYTGIIMPGRYIDTVISSIPSWNEAADFYLVGDGGTEYIQELSDLARKIGVYHRVKFMGAVKWNELVDYIDSSNAAFAFYKDNCLNNYYCSPNKLYEALSAGIPVIGTSNPMIEEVLTKLDFGVCINFKDINAETIGASVNRLLEKGITDEKRELIKETMINHYSWESQEANFRENLLNAINNTDN
jgi:glycosyltransferase involved in cell wall biosynthesis